MDSSVAYCGLRIYMWIFLIPLMLYSTDLSEQFQTGDGGNTLITQTCTLRASQVGLNWEKTTYVLLHSFCEHRSCECANESFSNEIYYLSNRNTNNRNKCTANRDFLSSPSSEKNTKTLMISHLI